MYIINDLILLRKLIQMKVLAAFPDSFVFYVANVRMTSFSSLFQSQIKNNCRVKIETVDENFDQYLITATVNYPGITIQELSSLYLISSNINSCLVTSPNESLFSHIANNEKASVVHIDDLINQNITDERIIKIYNLLKAA